MAKKFKHSFSEKKDCYKIKDLSLSDYGRKEIDLAISEMPGLAKLRKEFGDSKPLKDVKISGSLHMTIQTAVLIETLKHLGADIRWSSCNIFSTQDHAAAAVTAEDSACIFAWKGESIEDYWWCLEQAMFWPDGSGPDLIVDDGSDATLLIHEAVKAEIIFMETKKLPVIEVSDGPDLKEMKKRIIASLKKDPERWRRTIEKICGVSEETTTGVNRLKQMESRGELLLPVINVNNSVTKSKFDNIYGCKHSLTDGIKRATDVLISGKTVLVCGFGDVGKGCASSLKAEGAIVIVTEIDPICALQACMEGYKVRRLEDVIKKVDIIVTATGNKDVLLLEHMRRMKNNAIVCNIGHFDNEIDIIGLEKDQNVHKTNIKPQVDRYEFSNGNGILVLAEGRLVNLGCATGHPSFVMSNSFTNQVLAQMELWKERNSGKYKRQVYVLPKELDEKVARLHLDTFGAKLTELTSSQAKYIGLDVNGPYKKNDYRY